jgi:hypothetical protein
MTATASGLQVPAVPKVAPEASVTAHDDSATLDVDDFGLNHTNTGATGTVVLTLPAAADAAGMSLGIYLTAAEIVQLAPASGEKIYLAGSGTADELVNIAGVIGNFADVYCDGTQYLVQRYSGVVTKTT